MRWRQKLLIISVVSTAVVMGLLLTGVLTVHLMANRELVRSLVAARTAEVTGGTLHYDRLTLGYFPLPHLQAEGIDLSKPGTFDVRADELSVHLRIWPLLAGRVSIRRLALKQPDIRLAASSATSAGSMPTPSVPATTFPFEKSVRSSIAGLLGALSAVESGTDVLIQEGRLSLVFADAPDLDFTDIQLYGENEGGNLSINLECRSTVTGRLGLGLQADSAMGQTRVRISAGSLNLRPILYYASLPGDILTENTQARAEATFTIENPDAVTSRFNFSFPELKVMRNGLQLDLASAFISGELNVGTDGVTLSVDTFRSARPSLDLSAKARIVRKADTDRPTVEAHAAARQLDMAVASRVARSITGDLKAIRTAFAVAKEGQLNDVTYDVHFVPGNDGYRLARMEAAGHLRAGRITIPGIAADLENMEGDIHYRDARVTVTNSNGHFKGVTFNKLNAAIDWSAKPTLSIAATAVDVEAKPFTDWLFSIDGLASVRNTIQSVDGSARLSLLNISGPLTEPAEWKFNIHGTPADLRLSSPRLPFSASFSGGEIVYTPDGQTASGVTVNFLDGSVVAAFASERILNPEAFQCQLDGSVGPQAIDWLSTILPIPEHLQMKPPVNLAGVNIRRSATGGTSFEGTLTTAGGVALSADVSIFPQTWDIRRIEFADGRSQAVVSARKETGRIEMAFAGHVEKETADRLLETNRTLTGRLEGDFRAIIDTRRPINSAFAGHLTGQGVQIHQLFSDPVVVNHFAIDGSAGRILIAPSEILLQDQRMAVEGSLRNHSGELSLDLTVDAERLDAELIRAFQSRDGEKNSADQNRKSPLTPTFSGSVRIRTDELAYGNWIWSPMEATVHLDGQKFRVDVHRADLCGIATTGELTYSPAGLGLNITPQANAASFQGTARCFWDKTVQAEASYDLSGEIQLPPTTQDPLQAMTGRLDFASQNGRIAYSNTLMKIFAVLNITEVFTGGKSDLTEKGYGYTTAQVKAKIEGGNLLLEEILLDGNSLKLTGQGTIGLKDQQVNIALLAAPLKTVDRVVNKLPVISYIAGGSLVSIPLRVTGKLDNVAVATMPPSAVGKGLLNIMGRTLKAPFKLVQQAASLATENAANTKEKPEDTPPSDK